MWCEKKTWDAIGSQTMGIHVKMDSKQMVNNIQRQQSVAVVAHSVSSSVDTVKHI
jgi:hypothetical protein